MAKHNANCPAQRKLGFWTFLLREGLKPLNINVNICKYAYCNTLQGKVIINIIYSLRLEHFTGEQVDLKLPQTLQFVRDMSACRGL